MITPRQFLLARSRGLLPDLREPTTKPCDGVAIRLPSGACVTYDVLKVRAMTIMRRFDSCTPEQRNRIRSYEMITPRQFLLARSRGLHKEELS